MPKLTKDGLELSIATQRTRANLGELDVTVAIPGFINLCELALKGLETTRPEALCSAVTPEEWKHLVEMARQEGFIAGQLSALSPLLFSPQGTTPTTREGSADSSGKAGTEARHVTPADLQEACGIALAISGHFCENPDDWLRGHEKRLRELEKKARAQLPQSHAEEK